MQLKRCFAVKLGILLVLLMTAACQTTKPQISEDQYLNPAQMSEFMNNKKYTGFSQPNGVSFQAFIKNDGTIEGESGSSVDSGTWRLDDNVVCMKWDKWRYAEEYCIRVIERPDGRFQTYYLDGSKSSVFSLNE